jgi:serine/threonine-protein kinase RsbT
VVINVHVRVRIDEESDVFAARKRAREEAAMAGLTEPAGEELALAVSEVARNILVHAGRGEVLLGLTTRPDRPAVVVVARDDGPGIEDPGRVIEDGYSTGSGLGLGLPSARRLVDEFELESQPGIGTTVILRKWIPR